MPLQRRRGLVTAGIVVLVVLGAFTVFSSFYIDLLWFREVDLSSVFWTILRTKILLGVTFGFLFAALLYANLYIVRRLTPRYRAVTPDQEIVERYRLVFEPYLWWGLPLLAVVLGAFVGVGVSGQWRTFLLWRNGSGIAFGNPDPQFMRDPGFYVFNLPWLEFVQGWLFSSLVGITFLTALAHYLWGGIRPQAVTEKVTPQVQAHLSVLIGLIMLVKAWGYYLGRFDLLTSPRGVVTGASYTDVNAQLPALNLLALIAIVCAVLFLINVRYRRWAIPVIAVALLGLASIVVGFLYPAYVQRFRVAPQEQQREGEFIQKNIVATRRAFGLDAIDLVERPAEPVVTPAEVAENDATVSNIRLWKPFPILLENLKSLQRIRQYYEFNDVDVDRYAIDGERRVVMVSAREVSQGSLPVSGRSWQNQHLVYTHGFGAVATQVNTATPEGAPVFTLSNIPPSGQPDVSAQPRVYYGESEDVPYVVVRTDQEELDFEGAVEAQAYQGKGGIPIGGLFQRAMFAWRYRDVNLLISGLVNGDSRILINRNILERVPKAAPFLTFDGDPYAAVVEGRMVWIWDAYTTSSRYPYSQEVDVQEATDGVIPAAGSINYIRNPVKVVVDAYDGTMTYYVTDPVDPIIKAWQRAFPDLFTVEPAPLALQEHFRYPENLFQIQAWQYANYHVKDKDVFYTKRDVWGVPFDPTVLANDPNPDDTEVPRAQRLRPYYLLMRLPGEETEQFVLILPFTPEDRQNMVAWMAARSDPAGYGELVAYKFPSGRNVDGPSQIFSRLQEDPQFSEDQTLLGQGTSRVIFGDFLVIPIGEGLLYVQPVYVSSQENAIPLLKRVLVVNGEAVGISTDFTGALEDALGVAVGEPGEPPPGGGTLDEQIRALVRQALQHFSAAEEALQQGDLATYQSEIDQARDLIERANELARQAGQEGSPTPPPTESPTPTP